MPRDLTNPKLLTFEQQEQLLQEVKDEVVVLLERLRPVDRATREPDPICNLTHWLTVQVNRHDPSDVTVDIGGVYQILVEVDDNSDRIQYVCGHEDVIRGTYRHPDGSGEPDMPDFTINQLTFSARDAANAGVYYAMNFLLMQAQQSRDEELMGQDIMADEKMAKEYKDLQS